MEPRRPITAQYQDTAIVRMIPRRLNGLTVAAASYASGAHGRAEAG
jgi:hypothetical protein